MVIDWQAVNPAVTTKIHDDFSINFNISQKMISNLTYKSAQSIFNLG